MPKTWLVTSPSPPATLSIPVARKKGTRASNTRAKPKLAMPLPSRSRYGRTNGFRRSSEFSMGRLRGFEGAALRPGIIPAADESCGVELPATSCVQTGTVRGIQTEAAARSCIARRNLVRERGGRAGSAESPAPWRQCRWRWSFGRPCPIKLSPPKRRPFTG